jgi:hypothetical protein
VSENRFHSSPAGETVRAALAAADRWRRTRQASRHIWRGAPILAAVALGVALAGKALGWVPWLPFAILAAGGVGLALYAIVSRRPHTLSDAAAASIDAQAGLGGELRSASWFANREARTDWADFHLERAARHLDGINWAQLYPTVRAHRARFATALMIVAALVLTMTLPERVTTQRTASAATVTAAAGIRDPETGAELLSPELMEQLQALLAAAEAGNLKTVESIAQSAEMRDLLKKLADDPQFRAALERALANPETLRNFTAKELKAMSERARRAAEMEEMPPDLKEALEKLADEIELAEPDETASSDSEDPSGATGPQQGDTAQAKSPGGMQEMSIQFAKQADPSGGAGMMMMSNPDEKGSGPPGSGVGGSGSQEAAAAAAATLAAALKHEFVEAHKDTAGENVDTEIRRKTEHGSATAAFTQGAAAAFDKSRAAAPPAVPEARRSGVQTYFVRKPQ